MHKTRHLPFRAIGAIAAVSVAAIVGTGCSSSAKTARTASVSGATTATASYHGSLIVVAGHGEVMGTPDTLTMSIGVQTSRSTAQDALDQNSAEANTLIATLRGKGVDKKDIQTNNLSISPNFDKSQQITGYTVANTVTVTLHGIGKAGTIIDAAARSVGNDITLNGVSLSIGDTSALLRTARAAAVKQAVAHAGQLAQAAGMKLGTVRRIDDTGTELPQPEFFAQASSGAARTAAPIEAGQQQLSVDVAVTFALENA